MEIQKYRVEEHEEYLPDYQKPEYREGDIEKFKPALHEAVDSLEDITGFSAEGIKMVVAVTDEEELIDDAVDDHYFMGYSFDEGMRGFPGKAVFIRTSDKPENWEEAMKSMLVHELGHQIFYQTEVDWEDDQYHSIMFEGHAENLSRIVGEEKDWDYSPVWRKEEPIEVDKEVLYSDLELPRTHGDEDDDIDHNMFVSGGERWQDAEGYMISYQVVKYLIEKDRISIESMLEKPSEKWKEMVKESIEELY
ncbi:MAG: hypothetical protein ACI9LV_000997 [Candidatus Nanohaloarchaea archaeon]|jgi:hypothetical protein